MTAPTNLRTCYRHPDRVTGVACQRCDRPICPACMHQASVGFHCPECAQRGKQKVYQGAAAFTSTPLMTLTLIAVNVLAFLAMLATSAVEPFSEGGKALAFRFGEKGLFADGALIGSFVPDEPWRLVTGDFLHSNAIPFGFLHLGLNMYVLYVLGLFLEPALGRARFIALYAVSLCGGTLGVVLLSPTSVTVGASGAVFGLMGGALLVARERNIDLMRSGLVQTLAINLVFTFAISNISIGGHLGGLAGGAIGGLVLTEGARRLGKGGQAVAAAVTVGIGIALLVVSYVLMVGEYG